MLKKYKEGISHAEYSRSYREKNPERIIQQHAKDRAKRKNLDFNIEVSDIQIPIICPILGIPIIKNISESRAKGPSSNSPSLDRIDNSKGYIKGNVEFVCSLANKMMSNASGKDLVRFSKWINIRYNNIT